MTENTHYAPRLFARLIDLLFVAFVLLIIERLIPSIENSLLLFFWVYNVVVILLQGKTLGKYSLSLSVQSDLSGVNRFLILTAREILFLLLLPLLFLNFLTISAIPLHDRISKTRVLRNVF